MMKTTQRIPRRRPALLAWWACLFTIPVFVAAATDLPMILKTGVTTHSEEPATWTVDLRGITAKKAEALGDGLSSRLYAAGPTALRQPMTFRTGFGQEAVFGFYLSRAAVGGATLEVYVDDEYYHRMSWPRAAGTHEVDTLFHFPLPAGTDEVRLQALSGIVVIDAYCFVDTVAEFPSGLSEVELERQELPVADGKVAGYRGIWFTLGQFDGIFGDKYSGGLGTYTANHIPLAIYAEEVDKTFFVYGGTRPDEHYLLIMASYYDHKEHRVPQPTLVHDKLGVNDPHDNPSIVIDGEGHIWVFISGRGHRRPGFKYRSTEPYSVEEFQMVTEQEMTYPQPWWVEGEGFIHMFTKYTRGRELYWETSPDGRRWSEDQKLAGIRGHYQVSSEHNGKIGTFFNRHIGGRPDGRTDLYYMQTTDMGRTWTTVDGEVLETPLETEDNPARVIDYSEQGLLQYTVDLNWDLEGNPILLYVTAPSHEPGPANEPRLWRITRWNGDEWETHTVCRSDHNYDLGGLYIYPDRWLIIGPTGIGPQAWHTGGEIEFWESSDEGRSWFKTRQVTVNSERNHKYIRRPVNATDPFYYYWADGDSSQSSISKLYFGDSSGERIWALPYDMDAEYAEPREILVPQGP